MPNLAYMEENNIYKPLFWIGSSWADLKSLPDAVQDDFGYDLYRAQIGKMSPNAKPLKGFGGAGVLEIVTSYDGNAYRAVYTVRFAGAVYALHVFQKKSKKGISTPKQEIELVKARLKKAEADYINWMGNKKKD